MAENEELLLLTEKIERELISEYGHLIKVCNKVGEGEFNFACGNRQMASSREGGQ